VAILERVCLVSRMSLFHGENPGDSNLSELGGNEFILRRKLLCPKKLLQRAVVVESNARNNPSA
jgi:hypothetical protein